MLYILEERQNPNSKWKNYIELLPKDWKNFPILYSEEDMKFLTGSQIQRWAIRDRELLRKQYEFLVDKVPDFEK